MKRNKKAVSLPTDNFIRDVANNNLLFHDQFGETYLAVNGKGSKVLRLGSKNFAGWLDKCALDYYGAALKNNQATDIIRALNGLALYSDNREFYLEPRLHKINDEIWYDLGGEAVCITDKGWKIVKEPPIIFRRFSHQKPQVKPVKGGDIQLFRKFVNITDEKDWNLFLAFAVSTLVPDIPKPALVINGSQGAGKSTPMKMLKELVDPSLLASAGKITGAKDLAWLANRHSLLFFDNLSFLEKDNSDVLCRLITGDGFSKRKLYSDDDEIIYTYKRPLMLNGITNFITQADLLDRALILNVERIPEEKRLTELELWGKFEKEKSLILGAMFTILSEAMKIFPKTPTSGLPRMADFGRWGCAIYSVITDEPFEKFQQILTGNKGRQIEESIEADPVALAAKCLANEYVSIEFTAYDFLKGFDNGSTDVPEAVRFINEHTHWPKDSSQVGKRLRRAEGMLRESGIELSFSTVNNIRIIRLVDKNYPYLENLERLHFADGHCYVDDPDHFDRHQVLKRREYALMTPAEYAEALKLREQEFNRRFEEDTKLSQQRARAKERKIEREVAAQLEREAQSKKDSQDTSDSEDIKHDEIPF